MRIVFDNIVYSLQYSGGISVVWQELTSRFLLYNKVKVSFLEYSYDRENIFRKQIDIPEKCIDKRCSRWLTLNRYANPRVKCDKTFIFHSSYFRTCNNPNAINITTVHDFTYEYYRKGFPRKLHCWQKYRAIRHSAAIVCISENTKRDLLKFLPDIDERKIHVIYNGVSEDYFVTENQDNISLPFPSGSFVVFVGSRATYKNFGLVVRALAKTSLSLLIVGSKLSEKEEVFVSKYIPKSRYRSVGFLRNEELNVVYNCAAALVYPSSYEGFGIPVLEAQRAGCPVIAYNASSIPEVIGDTPLLMNELSEQELLSKLEMLKDERLMSEVIHEGLENSKRFSWDKMFQDYMTLYESLL